MSTQPSTEEVRLILERAGLRPTRQRMGLAQFLFGSGNRHITADDLHREAIDGGMRISLATVYNTLNQFSGVGLLRKVVINSERSYFDTDTGDHQHFYIEEEGKLLDVPTDSSMLRHLPSPPKGYGIKSIDVVIRLRYRGE